MVRESSRNRRQTAAEWGFRAGRLCLDLAATGGEGWRKRFEQLHTPRDLARWLGVMLGIEKVSVSLDGFLEAGCLREAIWFAANDVVNKTPIRAAHLETINRIAQKPPLAPELLQAGHRTWKTPVRGTAALSVVARDAIELFGSDAASRIRVCGASNCALLFFDTSRPGTRRWCSMSRCGNRAKLRGFRDRQRTKT